MKRAFLLLDAEGNTLSRMLCDNIFIAEELGRLDFPENFDRAVREPFAPTEPEFDLVRTRTGLTPDEVREILAANPHLTVIDLMD